MPIRLAGLWRGARGTFRRITARTFSSIKVGSVKSSPPWTTRWPIPASPAPSSPAREADEGLDDLLHPRPVVRNPAGHARLGHFPPGIACLMRQRTGCFPDPLHQAGGENRSIGHVEQLVLDRRASGVEDQDSHHAPFIDWAWMAVMATVLTMSVTVHPRLRSLTGLFNPCRTGPIATAPADLCTAL